MINVNDKILIGLVILSFCCSLVGLFFGKGNDFKQGLKTMIGGFFFGTVIAYVIHDSSFSEWFKRLGVLLTSMFAKPIYDKISNRIGYWLDKWIVTKIEKSGTTVDVSEPALPSQKFEEQVEIKVSDENNNKQTNLKDDTVID